MPEKLPITGPSVVQGLHADFLTNTDFLKRFPAAWNKMMTNNGYDSTFIDVLESLGMAGMSKPSDTPFADSYFEEKDERRFTVGTVVTAQTGPGAPVTIALPATEMKSINGMKTSRPRKKETIQDKNGKNWNIIDKITTQDPHRLVLQPALETQTGTFAAGDAFFIIGPSHAEGTGQPKGLISDIGMYTNTFAIMKETDLTTGTNMTTVQWRGVPGKEGVAFLEGIDKAERRHELNKSMMIVHGQVSDNITEYSPDAESDVEQKETEGLIQAFLTGGRIQRYDESVGYDYDNLEDAAAFYRQKKLPGGDILVMQGGVIGSQVQKALKDYLKISNSQDSLLAKKYFNKMKYNAADEFNADDWFMKLGIKGVGIGKYNFLFRSLTELDGLYGEGNTGFNYEGAQFFMPIEVRVNDPKNKVTIPGMQLLHRGLTNGGYQRRNEIWRTGGAGPIQKTDEWDVQRCFLRSEICLQIVGHNWLLSQLAEEGS